MLKFNFTLFILALVVFFNTASAQTPGGINYQGVARNQYLTGLNNKTIILRFTIRENTAAGTALFTETRNAQTDSFGVFSVVIGATGATSQSGPIKQVPWSNATKKFLQVEMDINEFPSTGLLNMGTTQLLSVPFSFYSDVCDSARISDTTRISDSTRGAAKATWAKVSEGSGQYFFSATVDPLASQPLPDGDGLTYNIPVKFPVVIDNEGNGYNPATAEFTAPEDGYYEFGVTIHHYMVSFSDGGDNFVYLDFGLLKNNKVIKSLGYYTATSNMNGSTSSNALMVNQKTTLKLAKSDTVSVRLRNSSDLPVFIRLNIATEDLPYLNATYEIQTFMEFSGHKIK